MLVLMKERTNRMCREIDIFHEFLIVKLDVLHDLIEGFLLENALHWFGYALYWIVDTYVKQNLI